MLSYNHIFVLTGLGRSPPEKQEGLGAAGPPIARRLPVAVGNSGPVAGCRLPVGIVTVRLPVAVGSNP